MELRLDQFDTTLANRFVLNYLAQHRREFLGHAQALGLPDAVAHAAAGAISEEMRRVYSADGETGFVDWLVDPHALHFSNESLARSFTDSLPRILDGTLNRSGRLGRADPWFIANKISNPMSIDLGPGNVNLGTASSDLLGYLNGPAYTNDPLGLRKYLLNSSDAPSGLVDAAQIDFRKFISDLRDINSPLTSAMAVLNVARGYQYLGQLYGSAFIDPQNVADLQKQAGLLGAFYKMGEARFRELVPVGVVGGIGSVLRDPTQLAGGRYSHDNFFAINSLLSPDGFEASPDAAPGSTRQRWPVPHLAQTQEAERFVSQQNPANPAGLSAAELDHFYAATGHPAADQSEAIANGTLRVTLPDSVAKRPAATGFPQRSIAPPLYLDATRAAQGLFAQVLRSDVPRFPSRTIPESIPGFPEPQRSPILPAPQPGKRSEAPDGSSPVYAQTSLTTPAFRRDGVYSAAGNFFPSFRVGGAAAVGLSPAAANPIKPASDPEPIAAGTPARYLRRVDSRPETPVIDGAVASIVPDEDFGSRQSYETLKRRTVPYPDAAPGDWPLPDMPQSRELVGLVSGKPMTFHSSPPPLFFPDPATRGDEDWLIRLLAPGYRG